MMEPHIVTYQELRVRLLPYCFGYKWAEDAIRDLWLLGAPTPDSTIGNERRILLPNQFARWWAEVCQRMGYGWNTKTILDGLGRKS